MRPSVASRVSAYVLGAALLAFILLPFAWVLSASLHTEVSLFKQPPDWLPSPVNIDNYIYVFTGQIPRNVELSGGLSSLITQEARAIPNGLVNSFTIAIGVAALNIALGTMAAYMFARVRFRGGGAAYYFVLVSRLLPPMAVAIPIFQIVRASGLLDTKTAVVLVHSSFTLPFTIWVLTLYFRALPQETEDAALVDGCGRLQALWHVALPAAAPGVAAIAAFSFLFSYNEFLFAQLILQTPASKTVPVLIAAISTNPDASYSLISVGVILAIFAPLALAIIFRHYITRGLITSLEK